MRSLQSRFPKWDALKMHNLAKHAQQEEKTGYTKKQIISFFVLSLIAIAIIWYGFAGASPIERAEKEIGGEIQKVTLSFKDYNYYPNTIIVKAGKPVEITLDNSIKGCFRSFNIKQLGISQYSSSPDNKIRFTPMKAGNYEFACSMRMGYGTLVVE